MTVWVEVLSYVITLLVGVIFGLLAGMKMYKPKNIVNSEAPEEKDEV